MNVLIGQGAGLPDIVGSFYTYTYQDGSPDGSFRTDILNTKQTIDGRENDRTYVKISFSASEVNNIYGKSNQVTVNNLSIRYWKRIA